MHSLTSKLAQRLGNQELAEILVEAGFGLPSDIRQATNARLLEIEGIGRRKLGLIRERFGRE